MPTAKSVRVSPGSIGDDAPKTAWPVVPAVKARGWPTRTTTPPAPRPAARTRRPRVVILIFLRILEYAAGSTPWPRVESRDRRTRTVATRSRP